MALTAGIVGLPNVGKSTLFNAITGASVEAANYPFATIDKNVGVVEVRDERIRILSQMYEPKKTIFTTFEFCDIAGLVKGASKGEGLGNQFLANIREVDAIIHVVRCFDNNDILHVEGRINPIDDIEIIELELQLADLNTIDNRIIKIEKKAKTNDKEALLEYNLLLRCKERLLAGEMLLGLEVNDNELKLIKTYHFLTYKPVIYVANVDESDLLDLNNCHYYQQVIEFASKNNSDVIPISARMEMELSTLDYGDQLEYLKEYNCQESGLDKIVKTAYHTLNLRTFFTVGKDEVRAWTFKEGMKAPACAGVIHSDFERGFIKAEVFAYDDLIALGNELAIKDAGKFRIEGKEYLVKDGDILHFRFNV